MRKIIATLAAALMTIAGLTVAATPASAAYACSTVPQGGEVRVGLYVTAYDWWDNTPPGSAAIAYPGFHTEASGAGTYDNPITLAVGHCIINGRTIPDYAVGTRWYDPMVKRYFRTEDLCGDGAQPQNGPCHTSENGYRQVDEWVNGRTDPTRGTASRACMEGITGVRTLIRNPVRGYDVPVTGSIFEHGATGCPRG